MFFSGNSLVYAGALWMRWTVARCTDLWRRGGVGVPASDCPHRCVRSLRALTWVWRKCRESGMLDLGRFPVSDEFISDRKTFCTILYRNVFFDFLNYWFWTKGHVTIEHMEMSGIALRIEWKHFRIPAGPSSGRNDPLKSRNLGFGHYGTFFQSLGKFENGGTKNFCWQCGANFF